MANRYLMVAFTVVLGLFFSACGNDEAAQQQAKADAVARAKRAAAEDSMAKALDSVNAAEAAEAREAEEQMGGGMDNMPTEGGAMEAPASDGSLKFHVIKGSFTIPENASNFLAAQQSSHPQAKIFEAPNGFKLVSIADFATMQEAVSMINSQGDGRLWVYQEGGVYNTSAWLEERSGLDDGFGGDSYSSGGGSSNDFGENEEVDSFDSDDDEFE